MSLLNSPTQVRGVNAPVSRVYHLPKEGLFNELAKRSIPVEGAFAELRQRLLQNLREESLAVSMPAPATMTATMNLSPTNLSPPYTDQLLAEPWKSSTTVALAETKQEDPWEAPVMIPTVVTTATVPTTSIITTMSSVTTVTPSWAAESTRFRPITKSFLPSPQVQPSYAPQPSYVQKENTRFQPITTAFVPPPQVQPSFAPQPSYVQVKTERPPLQTHRWKISFNGQGDPANFLERIEEICVAET